MAAAGKSPTDGFTEYEGGRPRWGDYGAAAVDGNSVWIASEYIAQPCTYTNWGGPFFVGGSGDNLLGTCGGASHGPGSRSALANWSTSVMYSPAGDVLPRLTGGNSVTSTVFTAAGNVVTSTWASARDAVSATIMRQNLMNEYMLETPTASGTDWVITFPTKFAYVNVGTGAAVAPFNANFNNGLSCDSFTATAWSR